MDFAWQEKERDKAIIAWQKWQSLTDAELEAIAKTLLEEIEPELRQALKVTLDTAVPRNVSGVEIIIETNLGESRRYLFDTVASAVEFLQDFNEEAIINDENGPSLWEVKSAEADIEDA